ncbi:MAG TPA: hypothetical protein HPP76_07405 [Desulfuromonadales bacterium]|nr:hypothetical protein [Desulfuromonadales bacterium]
MNWSWKQALMVIGATAGGGALALITCGAAAPAVGAMLGGAMGLSGTAGGSAGLAALGGGIIAGGGAVVAGGTAAGAMLGGATGHAGSAAGAGGIAALGAKHASVSGIGSTEKIAAGAKMSEKTGVAGSSLTKCSVPVERSGFESLQTIATNLTSEINGLKKAFDTTSGKNGQNREAIGQEIAAKEAKLNMIVEVMRS